MENKSTPSIAEECFNISQSFIEHEMHAESFDTAIAHIRRASHRGFLRAVLTIEEIPAIRSAPSDYADSAFNRLADNLNLKGFKTAFKTEGNGLLRKRLMFISWEMRGEAK